jgi:hypothetical protein
VIQLLKVTGDAIKKLKYRNVLSNCSNIRINDKNSYDTAVLEK